jgi:ATP-dependent exoDNAse (exonuclease V) beta subunit
MHAMAGHLRSHPIIDQMDPSHEQELAIWERGRDVVVTAGAGSGKTLTLVARYLALLAEGCLGPEAPHGLRSAVAITFTEKAAREMRNRVRDEIRRYLETPGLPKTERNRWQDLYIALDAARIGTIHALCAEILRSHPAEAAVDPRFEVLDEGQSNLLRRQAVDEALARTAEDPRLVRLFELFRERGLRDSLDSLIRRRLDAAEAFAALPADVLAHWQEVFGARQAQALAELTARPDWRSAVASLSSAAATAASRGAGGLARRRDHKHPRRPAGGAHMPG